ncbi:MFS transporter [Spongiactinospora sp. TRM90649]|uniref:MFS transporter n=1 Tax=Spongiactinospora sp. TRM90649 TaxID=3031114 RepID=UPI0023F80C42|nr:MFS transporter [Spongiactinospora sp. TRM90649]MDF5758759.1 MFS transporter [Spongiactinospora sp. TRM90649]
MSNVRRRWWILALGVNAHTLTTVGMFGLPVLLPAIRDELGVSLAVAGILTGAPSVGAMACLILWGMLADRSGERVVLGTGVTGCALLLGLAAMASQPAVLGVVLALMGAAGSAAIVGGGRIVLRWFPPELRGIAMGLRQVSFLLGMGLAAFVLPPVARAHGLGGALLACALATLVAGVLAAVFVADPPLPRTAPATASAPAERAASPSASPSATSPSASPSPYRKPELWRVHATSALLVVPQFVVSTYGVSSLVDGHAWSQVDAGRVFGAAALVGAAARLAAGYWSDRTGRRMAPLRVIVVATAVVMGLLAVAERMSPWAGVAALALAAVVTVSGNGLAYLGAGELAGPGWAGRVLGAHNTVQNVVSFLAVPALGVVIGVSGYWAGFGVGALCALAAVPLIPIVAERRAAAAKAAARPTPREDRTPTPCRG